MFRMSSKHTRIRGLDRGIMASYDGDTLGKHKLSRPNDDTDCNSASSCKKVGQIFTVFPEIVRSSVREELSHFVDSRLYDPEKRADNLMLLPTVASLKLLGCNGADSSCSYCFSDAYCDVERSREARPLALLFTPGIRMLKSYIEKGAVPDSKSHEIVLGKLLNFLMENRHSSSVDPLKDLGIFTDETELTSVLANHFFGKLSTSDHFLVDCHDKGKQQSTRCPCGNISCVLTGQFADTSIGHIDVWHGHVDIIINNDLVIHQPRKEELDEDSPGGEPPVEVETRSGDLKKNSQIIAETIVFSFLQKHRHPTNEHFLVPCIGVTDSQMVIYMYDSEHDVLLESCPFSLRVNFKMSITAVIVAWLVVNYKFTMSGLTDSLKGSKAEFFSLAKSKLTIYEECLEFGSVGEPSYIQSCISELPLVDGDLLKELF